MDSLTMLVQVFSATFSIADGHVEAARTKQKKKCAAPHIIVSTVTKLQNKIKGLTVIWWHWKCFSKCSSKDDTVMVSHCAFTCHSAFYSSYRLADALLDNPAILSSGSDKLSRMKVDVSIFCHFDLHELMPWKLMRMLHVKSKSICCGFFFLSLPFWETWEGVGGRCTLSDLEHGKV